MMADQIPGFEEIVEKAMAEYKLVGLSIAFVNGDDIETNVYSILLLDANLAHNTLGLRSCKVGDRNLYGKHAFRFRQHGEDNHSSGYCNTR